MKFAGALLAFADPNGLRAKNEFQHMGSDQSCRMSNSSKGPDLRACQAFLDLTDIPELPDSAKGESPGKAKGAKGAKGKGKGPGKGPGGVGGGWGLGWGWGWGEELGWVKIIARDMDRRVESFACTRVPFWVPGFDLDPTGGRRAVRLGGCPFIL